MARKTHSVFVLLGSHLFAPKHLSKYKDSTIFMAETHGLCTHYRYHKHKIILFLAAMREHADNLKKQGFSVHYEFLSKNSYTDLLRTYLKSKQISQIIHFEIEDKFMEEELADFCKKNKISQKVLPNPHFLTSRAQFGEYIKLSRRPFMKTFYEGQRKRLKILLQKDGKPTGGKWSFDSDNRKKLPKSLTPAPIPKITPSKIVSAVSDLVEKEFKDHPGESTQFWLPTTRTQTLKWFDSFLKERFSKFGDFQDALTTDFPFVFHSVISPLQNCGLITPDEIVERTLKAYKDEKIPLNAVEGFLRQVIGWREFVFGIYQQYSEQQDNDNFWKHTRKMRPCWYDGSTGLVPVDFAIKKALKYGYTHHIERLMVLGNVMLLCELNPKEVHKWFMELHVDSSDWVMGPNVYGMSQFSDGGIFATKPYICGSNYILKMGSFEKGDWTVELDGLYWRFISKHQDFYLKNPRMGMMVKLLKKMDPKRKTMLLKKADETIKRLTC